ncbi:MAG: hypothetical protein HQL40_16995 [Alphaproteobacteria bacterium]|nr:hypothetical protein [Alphaproteobacteria bacterium]MBF0335316.1 hypothetical protein [Alphaproteobacteria bacterium]
MNGKVNQGATAAAALTICENLLAVLIDREVLTPEDVDELLSDSAGLLADAEGEGGEEASALVEEIRTALAGREEPS